MSSIAMLAALLAAETAADSRGPFVLAARSAERLELPATGTLSLETDALDARIVVRMRRPPAALLRRVTQHTLCPKLTIREDEVELACRTTRLDALIVNERGHRYLEIFELRGLPWRGGEVTPLLRLPPPGSADPCRGDTSAERGECLLMAGKMTAAKTAFQEAQASAARNMAEMRLGDIALLANEAAAAERWFRSAAGPGPFGRLAAARLCELNGECLDDDAKFAATYRTDGLPPELAADLSLHAARAAAFTGRPGRAISLVAPGLASPDTIMCGGERLRFCRRVLLQALRATTREDGNAAIAAYLAMPAWDRGVLSRELASAAADLAGRMGAPVFGGNLMSSVAPQVPAPLLQDHLLRAAELYAAGDDMARAGLIVDFARSRSRRGLQGERWQQLQRRISYSRAQHASGRPQEEPELPSMEQVSRARQELADTRRDLDNARGLLKQAPPR